GDVHRAVRHGHGSTEPGRRVRAIVLERVLGQSVLVPAGALVLLLWPALRIGQLRGSLVIAVVVVLLAMLLFTATVLTRRKARRGRNRAAKCVAAFDAALRDLRALGNPGILGGTLLLSAGSIAGHLALFLVAARAVGVNAPVLHVLPPLVLALLAMSVPLNIGGWGPREGAAVAAFALAGLGAAQGVTTSVA